MIPYKWPLATAVPDNFQVRLEIAKAMQTLAQERDELLKQRQAEIASIRNDLQAIAQDIAKLCAQMSSSELRRYGYNLDEPRIPKYHAGGGEWTQIAGNDDLNATSDVPQFQEYGEGHHWIPEAVLKKFNFKPETRKVLENASSGALADPTVNYFSREHRQYNNAVEQDIKKFLTENDTTDADMTPEQAEILYRRIRGSSDPVIGGLNRKVLRQRLRYIEYFYLRGGGDEE